MHGADRRGHGRRALRCARLIVLAWMAAACSRQQVTPVSRITVPNEHAVGWTRIALRDHSVQTLTGVFVESDSAVGRDANGRRVAVALSDVAGVKTKEFSARRTVMLVVGIPVIAIGLVWLALETSCAFCE